MAKTPERTRNRLYLLHRWIGLVIGVLGTIVIFSGTVAVFHQELDSWADRRPDFSPVHALGDFDLERAYRVAMQGAPDAYRHRVDLEQELGGPLRVVAFDPKQPVGRSTTLDPSTLRILQRRDGPRAEILALAPRRTLARFVLDLHIFLLMPATLGLFATGLVGLGLLVLLLTGLLVHRPSWRTLSRPPRRTKRRRFLGDLHTLVGSWSLPFTLVIAVTGAFFSLSGIVLRPAIAVVAYGGDHGALVRDLVGSPEVRESEGVASLRPLLRDALVRAEGAELRRVRLERWEQPGAKATITLVHRELLGEARRIFVYDGQTGELVGEKPSLGARPSLGGWLLDLVDALHFGTLLGPVTRVLWFLLGLGTCGLAATGILIFAARQRDEHGPLARAMRALAIASSAGMPLTLALCVAAWASWCVMGRPDPAGAMTGALLLGLATSAVIGLRYPLERALAITLGGGGLGLLAMPMLAALANELPIHAAWTQGLGLRVAIVDLVLVVLGVSLLLVARSLGRRPGLWSTRSGAGERRASGLRSRA